MNLDLTPAAVAAPRWRQVRAHALTEAALLLRNGEQLLLALVIPIGILVAGRWFAAPLGLSFDEIAVSVLGLAIWSTCFTSLAITTAFERRYNVLERLAATPLGTSGVLLGKTLAFAMITAAQVAVLAAVAFAIGWRPQPEAGHLLVAVAASLLAMTVFAALGLALAGSTRAETTLGVANLVYLLGTAAGVLTPVDRFPGWSQQLVGALPTAALGEALRTGTPLSLPILAAWCIAGLLLARKVFSWTS